VPYRTPPASLLPLWGVYTRCTVRMLRIPDAPPETLIYFSLGGAPFVDPTETALIAAALTRLEHSQRAKYPIGLDELAGTVVRVEPDRTACIRRLTPNEALELEEAFVATRAVEGPALATHGNKTADYCEHVHLGGWFGARPFQVSYHGLVPYQLVGADVPAWEKFLALLHALANDP
jgi:hypothetical protein